MKHPELPWADIRSAYEQSTQTVEAIAASYGIRAREISENARLLGWTLRPRGTDALRLHQARRMIEAATVAGAIAPEAASAPLMTDVKARRPSSGGSETHRRAIIRRLYDVIDARLADMEARVATTNSLSAAEAERESRDLANLIKNFEKLMELSTALAKPANTDAAKPGSDAALAARALAAEAEQFRREIAERLDRLRSHGTPGAPTG